MKRIFFAIVIVLIGLTAFTADPPGTKVPIGLIVGAGKTKTVIDTTELKRIKDIDDKIDNSTLGSSLDEFYNKTQATSKFIDEAGDTITGVINVPTPAAGTNTTQVVNAEFVNQNVFRRVFPKSGENSGLPSSTTIGSNSIVTAVTYVLPAKSIGSNGKIIVMPDFNLAGTTNKYVRWYINGTLIEFSSFNTAFSYRPIWTIQNSNSTSSQISFISSGGSATGSINAAVNGGYVTTSFDTTQPLTITVTIQGTGGTDQVTLYGCDIYVCF